MKITLRLLAAATVAAVLGVTPAHAIVGGAPDGNAHPYVGFAGFYDSQGDQLWRCSGFLTNAHTFVTAGHCAGPEGPGAPQPALAAIWFSASGPGSSTPVFGIPEPNPAWNGVLPDHDIGVVHLPDAMPGPYAQPAPLGYLDDLAKKRGQQDVSFTVVGYGIVDLGPQGFINNFSRLAGTVQLEKLTDIDLLTTASPGNGTGGSATCLGDSGGAVLNGGYVVALVSAGTKYCNGKAADFRLDTFEAHSFIGS